MAEAVLGNFGETFAPQEQEIVKKKNPGKSAAIVVEARRQRLYKRQLEGLTTRQLVLDHAVKEGVCQKTAWTDWVAVKEWTKEDWKKTGKTCFPGCKV